MHYAITEAELDIFRQYQHGRIQKESSDMNAVKFKGGNNSLVNIWKPVLNLNSQHKSSLYSVRASKRKCWIGDGQNTRACLFFVIFFTPYLKRVWKWFGWEQNTNNKLAGSCANANCCQLFFGEMLHFLVLTTEAVPLLAACVVCSWKKKEGQNAGKTA